MFSLNYLKKIKNKNGTTLVELLCAILLMGIMGMMIVGAIPVIKDIMYKITVKARSEVLLYNTSVVLKDSLRYANDVIETNGKIRYEGNDSWWYEIDKDTNGWILIVPYKSKTTANPLSIEDSSIVKDWKILTQKTASENLIPTFDTISYESGIFKVTGLKVLDKDGEVVATYKGEDGNSKILNIRTIKE